MVPQSMVHRIPIMDTLVLGRRRWEEREEGEGRREKEEMWFIPAGGEKHGGSRHQLQG